MARALYGLLCLSLLFAGATPAPRAQDESGAPADQQDVRPYVPPPAWRSVDIANFYLRRKKYNAALSRFHEAVTTDPYYAPSYLGLGKVYEKIGLKHKALAAYKEYLDALPSEKQAEEAKDAHRAIARLERELKSAPSHARKQSEHTRAASQFH